LYRSMSFRPRTLVMAVRSIEAIAMLASCFLVIVREVGVMFPGLGN